MAAPSRRAEAVLGIGFALFAGTRPRPAEAVAFRQGWSVGLFLFYSTSAGGVLTVAYLGAGSAWLLLPKRGRDVILGALVTATTASITALLLAPVHATSSRRRPPIIPRAANVLGGNAFLWAVALNATGTLFLVGGSLLSIVRRRRVRANVWIAAGAIVVAAATGLSRTGVTSLMYIGELIGIACMFCGFTLPAPPPKRKPVAPAEHAAPATAAAR